MNSKSLSLLIMAVAFGTMGFAQGFHIGIKGGTNLSKIEGRSFNQEFRYGYTAGIFSEININKHWGIQPEVLWNQSNTRTTGEFKNIYHPSLSDVKDVKLNYLSVPLLASYRPVKFFTIQAGPQFGILINRKQNLLDNGRNAFKNGDLSLLGGVQFNIGGLKIGGRYTISLLDIKNLGGGETWRNHGFQLYAGLRIF
jgi:hypothetical protein